MVCSCFVASKGCPHRKSQAAWAGKARKALLLAHPSNPGGHFISYALPCFCSHHRPCVVKERNLLNRGHTLHACAPAPCAATACGSSTIPRMQETASPAYPIPQPRPEAPFQQNRPGVSVYVMLPLDTVSFATCCQSKDYHNWSAAKSWLSCRSTARGSFSMLPLHGSKGHLAYCKLLVLKALLLMSG